jgi:hypothetical protein
MVKKLERPVIARHVEVWSRNRGTLSADPDGTRQTGKTPLVIDWAEHHKAR